MAGFHPGYSVLAKHTFGDLPARRSWQFVHHDESLGKQLFGNPCGQLDTR